jgi:hypothetical protein
MTERTYYRFLVWRERHWATYTFLDLLYGTRPVISFPLNFSMCMQSAPDGEHTKGGIIEHWKHDENLLDHSWHFPLSTGFSDA